MKKNLAVLFFFLSAIFPTYASAYDLVYFEGKNLKNIFCPLVYPLYVFQADSATGTQKFSFPIGSGGCLSTSYFLDVTTGGIQIGSFAVIQGTTTNQQETSFWGNPDIARALEMNVQSLYFDGTNISSSTPPFPPISNVDYVQPLAPINATSTSKIINFTGRYTNGYDQENYDQIITALDNITLSQSYQIAEPIYQGGVDIPFSFPYNSSTTGQFQYRMRLQDSTTASSSIWSNYYFFAIDTSLSNLPTGTSTPVISCDPNSGFLQNSLCNLFVFLFVPSDDVFNKFSQLKDDIKDHAPFGYFTSAYSALLGLNGSSTPIFILSQVTPISTYIFTPIRTGLSWLLWFFALIFLYKRLTKIHI